MQTCAHMASGWNDRSHGFYVRLVVVSDHGTGCQVCTGQGLTKKGFRTGPIPFVSEEHVNDLPVFIHCAIQVQFSLASETEDFIHRPVPSDPPPVLPERSG